MQRYVTIQVACATGPQLAYSLSLTWCVFACYAKLTLHDLSPGYPLVNSF